MKFHMNVDKIAQYCTANGIDHRVKCNDEIFVDENISNEVFNTLLAIAMS